MRKFHEVEVPASVVAKDGYLAVGFINPPLNETVVLFPIEDGLEVLYKADTFTGQFRPGGPADPVPARVPGLPGRAGGQFPVVSRWRSCSAW